MVLTLAFVFFRRCRHREVVFVDRHRRRRRRHRRRRRRRRRRPFLLGYVMQGLKYRLQRIYATQTMQKKSSNSRKIARIARNSTIFAPNESSPRDLIPEKKSKEGNERKVFKKFEKFSKI